MRTGKRTFFDNSAHQWDNLFYTDADVHRRLNNLVLNFNIRKGSQVLDLGCGTGVISWRISESVGEKGNVMCSDFSFPMLETAKQSNKNKHLIFICTDAHNLPYKDRCFDHAVLFSCFPHFQDKENVLHEIHRILKKSGIITIAHLLSSSEIAHVHQHVQGVVAGDTMPAKAWMICHIEQIGFKILKFIDKTGLYLLKAEKV